MSSWIHHLHSHSPHVCGPVPFHILFSVSTLSTIIHMVAQTRNLASLLNNPVSVSYQPILPSKYLYSHRHCPNSDFAQFSLDCDSLLNGHPDYLPVPKPTFCFLLCSLSILSETQINFHVAICISHFCHQPGLIYDPWFPKA